MCAQVTQAAQATWPPSSPQDCSQKRDLGTSASKVNDHLDRLDAWLALLRMCRTRL